MGYQVNPRVDLAFKKIFGSPKNQDLLISLINSIVSEQDQVESIEVLNPYNEREFKNDKMSIIDIKAKDKNGQYYIIEMQVTDEKDYDKRALYYWARVYAGQLAKGMRYDQLRKTIGIHIIKFTSIPNSNQYHNCFRLKEIKKNIEYFDDIELHTIELSKFETSADEDIKTLTKKIKTGLDIWAAVLTRYDLLDKDKLPKPLNTPEVRKALDVMEGLSLTKKERDLYEARLQWYLLEASAIEKAADKAREKEKIEIATQMKKKGIEVEIILDCTGLSEAEIKKL